MPILQGAFPAVARKEKEREKRFSVLFLKCSYYFCSCISLSEIQREKGS